MLATWVQGLDKDPCPVNPDSRPLEIVWSGRLHPSLSVEALIEASYRIPGTRG